MSEIIELTDESSNDEKANSIQKHVFENREKHFE